MEKTGTIKKEIIGESGIYKTDFTKRLSRKITNKFNGFFTVNSSNFVRKVANLSKSFEHCMGKVEKTMPTISVTINKLKEKIFTTNDRTNFYIIRNYFALRKCREGHDHV